MVFVLVKFGLFWLVALCRLGLAFRLLTGWLYEFYAPDIKYVLMLKNRIYTNESAWSQLVELLSYAGKILETANLLYQKRDNKTTVALDFCIC